MPPPKRARKEGEATGAVAPVAEPLPDGLTAEGFPLDKNKKPIPFLILSLFLAAALLLPAGDATYIKYQTLGVLYLLCPAPGEKAPRAVCGICRAIIKLNMSAAGGGGSVSYGGFYQHMKSMHPAWWIATTAAEESAAAKEVVASLFGGSGGGGASSTDVGGSSCASCDKAHTCLVPPPSWRTLSDVRDKALDATALYFLVAGLGPHHASTSAYHALATSAFAGVVDPRLLSHSMESVHRGVRGVGVVPTPHLVDQRMNELCERHKAATQTRIRKEILTPGILGPRWFAVLADKWTSIERRGWLGVSIQFLTRDGVLETELLGVVYCTEGSTLPTRTALVTLLNEFGLSLEHAIPCTDAGAPMPSVFEGTPAEDRWTRCCSHILDNCARAVFERNALAKSLLDDASEVVQALRVSTKRAGVLAALVAEFNSGLEVELALATEAGDAVLAQSLSARRIVRKPAPPSDVRWLGTVWLVETLLPHIPVLSKLLASPKLIQFREGKKPKEGLVVAEPKGKRFFAALQRLTESANVGLLTAMHDEYLQPIGKVTGKIQGRDWFDPLYLADVDRLCAIMKTQGGLDAPAPPPAVHTPAQRLVRSLSAAFYREMETRYLGKLPPHLSHVMMFASEYVYDALSEVGVDGVWTQSPTLVGHSSWMLAHAVLCLQKTSAYTSVVLPPLLAEKLANMPRATALDIAAHNAAHNRAEHIARTHLTADVAAAYDKEIRTYSGFVQDVVGDARQRYEVSLLDLKGKRDSAMRGTSAYLAACDAVENASYVTVDALEAWRRFAKGQAESKYAATPLLHELGGHWLCTKVSAAEIERVFSLCGHILGPRRNKLGHAKVSAWLRACYQLRKVGADARYDGVRGEGVVNPHADVGAALRKALEPCSFEEAE